MALARRPDPKLEELRNSVEPKEDVHLIATELQALTSKIHVAYLFEKEGREALKKLCLRIGASAKGKFSRDWETFAYHLGLCSDQMKNIEDHFQLGEGPVWITLRAYARRENATIKELIHFLWEMKRYDLISEINEEIRKLVESLSDRLNSERILKPSRELDVPLVLLPLDESRITNDTSMSLEDTRINNGEIGYSPKRPSAWAAKVFLTFANDGKEAAQRIAEVFRSHKPRIGVLILEEQLSKMSPQGSKFVDFMLREVDNIIPILSKGYFDKINNTSTAVTLHSSIEYDDQYVEYIYESFKVEYIHNKCTSQRVRCILPNGMMARDLPNRSPALENWFSEAEITTLAKLLLIEKKNKKRARKLMKCNES